MIASLPRENYACQKKMNTPTGSPFNSTSLLKSPVVSVPSNDVTNNLKKEGRMKKRTQKLPNIFVNLDLDYSTPERAKLSYVKFN